MRWRRGVKIYKVRSVDAELEELSKLNKDNVVRIMDRSRERAGEKISSESGLYRPKRDAQEEFLKEKELLNEIEFAPRKISFRDAVADLKREREVSLASSFSEQARYSDFDQQASDFSQDGYDDYDSDLNSWEDFSVASMFEQKAATVRTLELDHADAERLKADATKEDKDALVINQNIKREDSAESDAECEIKEDNKIARFIAREENSAEESVEYAEKRDVQFVQEFEKAGSLDMQEEKDDQAAALRRRAQERDSFHASTFDARIRPFEPERISSSELEQQRFKTVLPAQQESAVSQTEDNLEEPDVDNSLKVKVDKSEYAQYEQKTSKETLSPKQERQLRQIMKKIQGAASPKERLAAEREAIRLGMADVLLESDGANEVRPEILDEMGFTPGGEKEEKQTKKRRFWHRRKAKKAVLENIDAENADARVEDIESTAITAEQPSKQPEKTRSEQEARAFTEGTGSRRRATEHKTSRSAIMRNAQERERYIIKIKAKIEKAKKDYRQMQDHYDELTDCLNDLVLLKELPDTVNGQIRKYAQQVTHYQREQEKLRNSREMEDASYLLMSENSDQMPAIIKRLGEDEAYASKIKMEIDRLENEKAGCRIEKEQTEEQRRHTKTISIAVIVGMILTITLLVVLQFAFELDMQLPILLFGVCAVLVTLSIFARFFRTESDETVNAHMLNRLIKKQNQKKAKYVNALNGVEYLYNKYQVQSSAELLYLWEKYQRVHKDREDYKMAVTEISFYERRLLKLLDDYGLQKADLWASRIDYFVEYGKLDQLKDEMNKKRNQLKKRMEKCQRVISNLRQELSVLVIKFPQYAKEIKILIEK